MKKYFIGAILVLGLMFAGMESAQAVTIPGDNTFALDFVANGDGGGGSQQPPRGRLLEMGWQSDTRDTDGDRFRGRIRQFLELQRFL